MQHTRGIFSEFEYMHQHMDEMWERLTGSRSGRGRFCPPILIPAVDVYETQDQVVVLSEIAGISEEGVEVSVEGTRLSFRGEKNDHHAGPDHRHSQMEICYGLFERTVDLPAAVDAAGMDIWYGDGFLRIILPKLKRQRRHQMRVSMRQPGVRKQ
jgi:HSP20 family molecular chaperone IbpA